MTRRWIPQICYKLRRNIASTIKALTRIFLFILQYRAGYIIIFIILINVFQVVTLDLRIVKGGIVFEISINEVLRGLHLGETRWLDLPHSVFVKIAIGLEKEGITVGNWKALAERLGKYNS